MKKSQKTRLNNIVVIAVEASDERDPLILSEQINMLDLLRRFFSLHLTYRYTLSEAMMGKTDLAVSSVTIPFQIAGRKLRP